MDNKIIVLPFSEILKINDSRKILKMKKDEKILASLFTKNDLLHETEITPESLKGRVEFLYVIDILAYQQDGKRKIVMDKARNPSGKYECKYKNIENWIKSVGLPDEWLKELKN